jgi:hypothetical protein
MEKINSSDLGKIFESDDVAQMLQIFRTPVLKLSELHELKIIKSTYNQWKKEGILINLLSKPESEEKTKWQKFSILETIILQIVSCLWEKGNQSHFIKEIVDELIESKSLNEILNHLVAQKINSISFNKIRNSDDTNLLAYLIKQKETNPNLPPITHIEALLIGSIKMGNRFSLLIFENGTIEFLFQPVLFSTNKPLLSDKHLNEHFEHIPVTKLLKNISRISDNTPTENTLTLESKIVLKFIEKGYSFESIKRLFEGNHDAEIAEEIKIESPQNQVIERLIRANAHQDIYIQIRDGIKKNITIFKYNKSKSNEN